MSDARVSDLVERAFDYRGYVTVRRRDGTELVGYLYDRGPAHVDLLDESATGRTRLSREEIEDIRFTGEDPAQKSQEIWERRKGSLEPKESPAYGQWSEEGPILLLLALRQELRHAARALHLRVRGKSARGRVDDAEVVIRAVGVGGGAARAVQDEEARLVVSCGFCGALDPSLVPGDLVLATSVRDEGGDVLDAPAGLLDQARRALAGLPIREGQLLCVTSVAASAAEKRALAQGGAIAIDMESHPAARAAANARIPWLAVRAVVDAAGAALPPFAREGRDGYAAAALAYAISRPSSSLELFRLAKDSRRAGQSVEAALRRLAPVFAREGRR